MKGIDRLQNACRKSLRSFKRVSPTILSCAAIVGVVGTAVLTARAVRRSARILQKAEEGRDGKLTKLETAKAAVPAYIPAAIVGSLTIGCILEANLLNKKQQAALASSYILLSQSQRKYRKAAKAVFGGDADSKIVSRMAKDTYISADGLSLYSPDLDRMSGKMLFYDTFSDRYFTTSISAVLNAQYHLNRNLTLRGDAAVNEFYEFLGIDPIEEGDVIGWSSEEMLESGLLWLDFENAYTRLDDGMECCVISACVSPAPLSEYVPF